MFRLLFLLIAAVALSDAAKILVAFPFPSKSHSILGDGVVNALAKAGHQITYITAFPKSNPGANVTQLDVSDNEALAPDPTREHLEALLSNSRADIDISSFISSLSKMFSNSIENKAIQKLINDPKEEFDVAIIEWLFYEVFAGLATIFNCPYIWVSSVDPHWRILSLIDDLSNPAYTPDVMSDTLPPYSFFTRAKELGLTIMGLGLKYLLIDPAQERDYDKHIVPVLQKRGLPVPPLNEVLYNASLILSNSHVSIGNAMRLPQNFIPVGGYHIDRDVKPLPDDLKKLLDDSKNGLIYFSLGSNIKSKFLPEELKQSLLKMFGSLKQTVLWKFEEKLSGTPPNVHIVKWAPQHAILAHPKCVIFLTHGGLLSTTEAVHFGKPIIALPIFGDQFGNAERAAQRGIGVKVDLTYNVADDIQLAIDEILRNPSYSIKAKELSMIYHDRPMTPDAELVHWVQHVVKTRGAPHLRSPALHVPWYQKMYLDLAVVTLIIIILIVMTFKRALLYCKNQFVSDQKKKS